MKFRYLLVLFLAVIGLLSGTRALPLYAAPAEPTSFKNVMLWINPEYDDPRLLVMLEGKIVGATAPAMVKFLVPSSAFMYSAGSMDAQGKYTGGPPARTASSIPGWDEISYTVTSDTFRVEYYDPNAIVGQPDKNIAYDFRWLYPISDLTVIVQQPRTASNFDVTPKGLPGIDRDGLNTQTSTFQNLAADGSLLHFDIAYTKADSSVSVENSQINSGASKGSTNIGLILGVIAGIAVIGGAMWMIKSRGASKRPAKRTASRQTAPVSSPKRHSAKFCSNCGKQVEASHRFCPECGSKIE